MLAHEEMKKEVRELAKKLNCVILAHNYQVPEIQECADFVGDSLDLCRKAAGVKADYILFAGVDFMAETAAILNPEKKVIVPSTGAVCPMAAMLSREEVLEAKKKYPGAGVVLYVNTRAEAKAEADVVCTSANVVEIVKSMPQKTILFGPDENLAYFVQKRVPEKKIIAIPANGHCLTHAKLITKSDVDIVKLDHPNALVLVHPECSPEVQEMADYIESTNGMVKTAASRPEKEFIIVTENGLISRLDREVPGKKFYGIDCAICKAMKQNTLEGVRNALVKKGPIVSVPPETAARARKAIEKMLG